MRTHADHFKCTQPTNLLVFQFCYFIVCLFQLLRNTVVQRLCLCQLKPQQHLIHKLSKHVLQTILKLEQNGHEFAKKAVWHLPANQLDVTACSLRFAMAGPIFNILVTLTHLHIRTPPPIMR